MAETTTEPIEKEAKTSPDGGMVGTQPPKTGRGRPRTTKNDDDPERQPFFVHIKSYAETDWQEILYMYLYRCEPYTDRKATGNHNYIRKYSKAIEQEDIKLEFGSGAYKLMLIRFDPETHKYHQVETHFFTIMDAAYPPKIPLGEWVDNERNKEWAWCKPLLEAEAAKLKVTTPSATGGGVPDIAMFNAVMDRVEKLNPGKDRGELSTMAQLVVQTVQGQVKANGESQTNVMAVVDRIIGALKPSGDGESLMLKILVSQADAAEKRALEERIANRELLAKLLDRPAPAPPPTLMDQLSVLAGVKDTLRGLFGRENSGAKGTDWPEVVRDVGGEVVKTIGAGLEFAAARKKAELAKRQPQPTVQNHQLTAAKAPQPAATPNPGNPQPAQPAPQDEQVVRMQEINQQFGWMFDRVAPELSNIFADDEPGMVFRDWFIQQYGTFIYDQVKQFSVETFVTLIEIRKVQGDATVQERLKVLQPPEKVAQFIQEFLSDEPVEDEDDTPEAEAQGKASDF